MATKAFSTFTDQVTEQLRQGMAEGRWRKTLPGRNKLAKELGCSSWTVEEAIQRLIKEGLVVSPGAGAKRQIAKQGPSKVAAMRVMLMAYERSDMESADLLEIIYRLNLAGHAATFADKSLTDLGMDVNRLARFVKKTEADAWVIQSSSREILQWFVDENVPAFALYGRANQVQIASTAVQKAKAMDELLERLFEWGHRRIVLLSREERRKPTPGAFEQGFLDKLERFGIRTGSYNLPDWEDDPDGLRDCLDRLFSHTPPTAVIVDDTTFFLAVMQHLTQMGISAPGQVSLACTHYSTTFNWCRPKVTHISWDFSACVKHVVNWTNQIGRGKNNHRKSFTPAKLLLGGTTGPAPKILNP